jgi:hypothetical protein
MLSVPDRPLVIAIAVVLVTLAGYIWIAWKVSPLKAMIFGIASIPAAYLTAYAVQHIANAPNPPSNSIVGFDYVLWYWVIGVLWPCGIVAFVIGLLRFALQLWRSNFQRRPSTQN